MNEYDFAHEHYINEDEGNIMLNLQAAYPDNTIHEIARTAISSENNTLLRALVAYPSYLPIRWSAFIDIAPTNIILIFYDHLSPFEQKRAAYKMRLPSMVNRFPPDYTLAKRYSYAPLIDQFNPTEVVRYLDADRISLVANKNNVYEIIDLIFEYGRVDALEEVVRNRNINLDDILPEYTDRLLPRQSMAYLFNHNVYETSEIEGIPINVVRAIVFDDPSLLDSSFVPTAMTMNMIYEYDSLNVFKRLAQVPINELAPIHGNIMRYVITMYPTTELRQLVTRMDASDMMLALSIYDENKPLRLAILQEATIKGYIEVLDKYMQDMDLFTILASIHPDNTPMIKFIDYRFKDAASLMLSLGESRQRVGISRESSFINNLMKAAIATGNLPLMETLKSFVSNIDVQQLVRTYYADQPQTLLLLSDVLS